MMYYDSIVRHIVLFEVPASPWPEVHLVQFIIQEIKDKS